MILLREILMKFYTAREHALCGGVGIPLPTDLSTRYLHDE